MKKTYIAALGLLLSSAAWSQDIGSVLSYMNDIYTWSQSDQLGSARTLGMGNAVTAVGGDLGTVAINPAGSAVAKYNQATFTPGISIAASSSYGNLQSDGNVYMGNRVSSAKAAYTTPSAGITIKINTGNIFGVKRISFGFLYNTSMRWEDSMEGYGIAKAGTSSIAASLASAMTGVHSDNWSTLQALAWNSDMVSRVPGNDYKLMGVTEAALSDGTTELAGDISQKYRYERSGNKSDYIFNMGFNISDIIFVGANIGISSIRYGYQTTYQEAAFNSSDFWTGFKSLSTSYSYDMRAVGVYGKFGIIATPVGGLRLGMTLETPTSYNVTEGFTNSASTRLGEASPMNRSKSVNDIYYSMSTPLRFGLGAAYTIGGNLLISADYELVNYSKAKFKAKYQEDKDWFGNINDQIKGMGNYSSQDHLGTAHTLRAGLEYKPLASIAVRAGYNLITDGTRYYGDDGLIRSNTHAVSAGLGWYSNRSFFADLAFRCIMRPGATHEVYKAYDNRGEYDTYRDISGVSVSNKVRPLMTAAVTLGWRF